MEPLVRGRARRRQARGAASSRGPPEEPGTTKWSAPRPARRRARSARPEGDQRELAQRWSASPAARAAGLRPGDLLTPWKYSAPGDDFRNLFMARCTERGSA